MVTPLHKNIELTIVIPAFNAESTIRRCITSILDQYDERIEIIIIDDCSTDGTLDEVCGINSGLLRIESHSMNSGSGSARNTGIDLAIGEYIWFIDSDDWIDNGHVNAILEAIDSTSELDLMIFGLRSIYERGIQEDALKCPINLAESFVLDEVSCSVSTKVYRKSILINHKIRFPSLRNGEDIAFNAAFFSHVEQHVIIDNFRYNHECRYPSATKIEFTFELVKRHEQANRFVEKYLKHTTTSFDEKFFARRFRYTFICSLKRIASDRICGRESKGISLFENFIRRSFPGRKVASCRYLKLKEQAIFLVFLVSPRIAYLICERLIKG